MKNHGDSAKTAARLVAVTKYYGETLVLDRFTLDLELGSVTALLGSNGVGKSTIMALLHGVSQPDSGAMIKAVSGSALLPQRAAESLFPHFTILRNICIPLEVQGQHAREAVSRVASELDRFGLTESLSPILSRRSFEVSGGQQQLAALARALVEEPGLLLLDEPVKELDSGHARAIVRTIDQWHKGREEKTVVLTSHNLEHVLRVATRAILLSGPPARIEGDWQLAPTAATGRVSEKDVPPAVDTIRAITEALAAITRVETRRY